MMGVQREERYSLFYLFFFIGLSLLLPLCLFFWIYKIISLKVSKKKSEKEEEEEERREELSKKEKRRDELFFFFLCGNRRQLYILINHLMDFCC